MSAATLALGIALVFGAGAAFGWQLARRVTGYMLDGDRRP